MAFAGMEAEVDTLLLSAQRLDAVLNGEYCHVPFGQSRARL